MATLYISPTGSGTGDGSSIENAGTLATLNKFITAAGPGGEVLLLADQGTYQRGTQISISAGGTADAPVTIRGIDSDGNPMAAEINGTRAPNWAPGLSEGNELFRLLGGANNLVFEDLSFSNIGNGAFRIGADISNLTIRDVDAKNVSRFIENYVSGTATTASVDGLTVQDITVLGYSQNAIRLQYNSRNVVIENVLGDSQGQKGGLYIAGVALSGTVHDVLLSHVEMRNNYGSGTASDYWNGDGFMTERGVYNVRFEDTIASGNTDAGYDLKSSNTVLIRTVAEGNNENYRFWSSSITMTDGVSRSPYHYGGVGSLAHVWLATGADVTLERFSFSDSGSLSTLFNLGQTGATLRLRDTDVPPAYADKIKLYGTSVILHSHTPSAIALTGGTVEENAAGGTVVGTLSATDADAGDTHTFAIMGGDSNLFEIVGNQVRVKAGAQLDYEATTSHTLTVTATDSSGLSVTKTFSIAVGNVVETVTGTAGNDVLTGGIGADRLVGGAGNDTYTVNAAGDLVVELSGQGTDLVKATIASYTLTDNVENLTYIGSGDFSGTGNALSNVIIGGGGNDTLSGGAGNDTLTGGNGNDTLLGAAGNDKMAGGAGDDLYSVSATKDVVTEAAGAGFDTVRCSLSYTLGSNVEALILTGSNAINGTGNALANRITGNGSANILSGGSGDDTLDGGAGNDKLIGGQGADTYLFGIGSGADLISNADTDLAADTLVFGSGIDESELWFTRSGSDLVVSVLGTSDRATLQGWYSDADNQLNQLELSDGTFLEAAQVQQLVDAMSGFAMQPASLSALTSEQQQSIETEIAANWHSAA